MFFVMILHLIFFDLFVLLVSLEWPGHPNPSYSLPSKLPCICAPAYVYYEMLLYMLMEYCTLVTSQPGESLKCPIHQCQIIGMYILKSQLNVCFSFFAV